MKYAKIDSYNNARTNGVGRWISEQRLYKIIEEDDDYPDWFCIEDDNGQLCRCLANGCLHLGGGNWKIVEVEDE